MTPVDSPDLPPAVMDEKHFDPERPFSGIGRHDDSRRDARVEGGAAGRTNQGPITFGQVHGSRAAAAIPMLSHPAQEMQGVTGQLELTPCAISCIDEPKTALAGHAFIPFIFRRLPIMIITVGHAGGAPPNRPAAMPPFYDKGFAKGGRCLPGSDALSRPQPRTALV